jgi:hypothetical protein
VRTIITELLRDFGTINKLPQTSAFPPAINVGTNIPFPYDKNPFPPASVGQRGANAEPLTEPEESSQNGIWTAPKVVELHFAHIGVCAVQLSTEILVLKSKICQRGKFAAPHSV